MITRYAIFNGTVRKGQKVAMRTFVNEKLVPLWRKFACAQEIRVMFGAVQDPNGPEIPLILAISYADYNAMEQALASPARYASRDILPELYEKYLDDAHLYHYVMDTERFQN